MFSSNQILEISGGLNNEKELANAIDFAIRLDGGMQPFQALLMQETLTGALCIGKSYTNVDGEANEFPAGWAALPFHYDLTILALILKQKLDLQKVYEGSHDGSYSKGFLLKAVNDDDFTNSDIQNPEYAIFCVWPYTNFFAK